jgi:flagellar basal body-associated protein FliL
MSLWKKISLGVLIFIVLLLGTVAFLVGTTTGLRSHQKRHRTEQQHDKNQHPEAYFLP